MAGVVLHHSKHVKNISLKLYLRDSATWLGLVWKYRWWTLFAIVHLMEKLEFSILRNEKKKSFLNK